MKKASLWPAGISGLLACAVVAAAVPAFAQQPGTPAKPPVPPPSAAAAAAAAAPEPMVPTTPPPTQPPASGIKIGGFASESTPTLLAPGGAAGQIVQLSATDVRQRLRVDVPIEGNTIVLSLDKALEIAIQQNGDLIVQRYSRQESRLGILQALGLYDLMLSASSNYAATPIGASTTTSFGSVNGASTVNGADTAKASSASPPPLITSTETKSWTWDASLNQTLPSGATVTLAWDSNRFVEPSAVTSVGQVPLPPVTYGSGVTFNVTQPLLRNRGTEATENTILVARANSEISHYALQSQLITLTQNVINAYWILVNARESLVVAQESLQLARDLNEHNRIQVEVGTLAPLEMVQSEAAIATREEAIISAQAAIGNAEDQLRLLLNLQTGDLWKMEIRPTTPPETGRISVNLEDAIAIAHENRPELHNSEINVKLAQINAALQHNLERPQLNLVGGYGLTGADYTYAATLNQISGLDFRSWNVGLTFAIPLPNRTARARALIADLDVERNQASLEQQKLTILASVRTAARAVETAAKDIDASHAARGYQEKNLDAEKKRYENGMSTSFLVTQIQDQLTQAKQTEVNSITNYRLALAQYYLSIGKLLEVEGIQLVDPGERYPRFTLRWQP